MTGKVLTASSTADTKVEDSTSEQKKAILLADAKVEKEYGANALEVRNSIRNIVNEWENSGKQLSKISLSIGYALVKSYKNFSNEERKFYWSIVETTKCSQKTMERAMELVLEEGVSLSTAMDTKGGTDDIEENAELLIFDKRLFNLYNDDLANVKTPTLTKLRNMKGLSDEAWDLTCSGISEKPYNAYMKEKKEKEKKKKIEELLLDKPVSMSDETYLGYCDDAKAAISAIDDRNILIAKLTEELEYFKALTLKNASASENISEELIAMPTEAKLSQLSEKEEV